MSAGVSLSADVFGSVLLDAGLYLNIRIAHLPLDGIYASPVDLDGVIYSIGSVQGVGLTAVNGDTGAVLWSDSLNPNPNTDNLEYSVSPVVAP